MSRQKPSAEPEANLTLIGHLVELRDRVMKSLLAILIVFMSLIYFANDIYELVAKPIRDQLPEGTTMIATDVTSTFFAPFKLTLVVAFFLAMPVILGQIWRFIAPGLYAHERKFALPLLVLSVLLFYSGIAFAHFVIFPLIMNFFVMASPENVTVTPDIAQYLTIALKLFFAFGLAFEIPIATMLLILSGVTTVKDLASKRPYVILFCFVFGMLLTPPDPFSQSMLAVPMWLLFEMGLLIGRLIKRSPKETEAATTGQLDKSDS
ncbi:MAG: twin-arginine translocase subunit TatC [Pseudomonadales bacterium]|jgi:sec-independent protein translocase protein TatC|nr:twin-arginine translocase subunit TatC [Pseudomonadales bacterium]MEC8811784.1 twin-arginine translocase subunit TatC [Pseudomonadota bacterium]TNC85586.1 MAG: twin-arginine translocase subunit TatC [Alcanivorax sp.]HAG97030.1 twin-arginine translocase subunit TatC [Gammaproteobacteria bacterium]MAQ27371.1 twin-arginine translocase subunit TatC [Pseudomonadales bacterium]|tara:strand:+ start:56615 stop:57406 length:792 start_codon:yes stop_codon:yes gene_type:complete